MRKTLEIVKKASVPSFIEASEVFRDINIGTPRARIDIAYDREDRVNAGPLAFTVASSYLSAWAFLGTTVLQLPMTALFPTLVLYSFSSPLLGSIAHCLIPSSTMAYLFFGDYRHNIAYRGYMELQERLSFSLCQLSLHRKIFNLVGDMYSTAVRDILVVLSLVAIPVEFLALTPFKILYAFGKKMCKKSRFLGWILKFDENSKLAEKLYHFFQSPLSIIAGAWMVIECSINKHILSNLFVCNHKICHKVEGLVCKIFGKEEPAENENRVSILSVLSNRRINHDLSEGWNMIKKGIVNFYAFPLSLCKDIVTIGLVTVSSPVAVVEGMCGSLLRRWSNNLEHEGDQAMSRSRSSSSSD